MQIAIVGTGNMARGIGSRALAGGHDVAFLGTDRAKAEALAGDLGGKVIVDITNPVDFSTFEPVTLDAGSAAQEIAAAAPEGANVVKAFNTTFASTLAEGTVAGQPLDVFIAGDDDGAEATVRQIVEDGGLRAVDVGPLARARELEALGYLHTAVQGPLDTGFSSTVKIVS